MPDSSKPDQDQRQAIWLRVSEARLQSDSKRSPCQVRLVGDCEDPKPVWWPVADEALRGASMTMNGFEIYKAILHELDKKRIVTARLGCSWGNGSGSAGGGEADSGAADSTDEHSLECQALRFQSPELVGH